MRRGEPDPEELKQAKLSLTPETAFQEIDELLSAARPVQSEQKSQESGGPVEENHQSAVIERASRLRREAQLRKERRRAELEAADNARFEQARIEAEQEREEQRQREAKRLAEPTPGEQSIIESRGVRYSPRFEKRPRRWSLKRLFNLIGR